MAASTFLLLKATVLFSLSSILLHPTQEESRSGPPPPTQPSKLRNPTPKPCMPTDTANFRTRSSRPHSLPLSTRTGTRPTLRQRRRHPAPSPRARGRCASTTRRPRRPPKALVPVTPRPSAATGFVHQGVWHLRRRTAASPTRSAPGCRQQAEGQSQVRGEKPTARPGTDLWRPPSSPAADAAVCTHDDACVTSGNELAGLPCNFIS